MKRYKITKEFIEAIKESKYSLCQLVKLAGFNVKNIYYRNKSINENHFKKLIQLLDLNINLKEIKFDYTKNLREYAFTEQIKYIKKNAKSAEAIGILLGDGNIHNNRINIAFDKRDKRYIRYVKNLFLDLTGIKMRKHVYTKTNQAYLYCYNQFLAQKIIEFGLKRGNKKLNKLGIPNWIKENNNYSKSCVKGLIDTDGCIYRCKRERRIYIRFTNLNNQLMNDFKKVTKILGYNFAKAGYKDITLYKKEQVAKFIRDIKPFKNIGDVVQLGELKNSSN